MRKNAVIFARSSGGRAVIQKQVRVLTKYATQNNIKVVATVTLPHCSAHNYEAEANLTALLGRSRNRFGMIIVTDLSRLSGRGVPHAMNLIKRFADAGVTVVTPDLGVINETLWKSFPLLMKGWAKWRKKRNVVIPNKKEEASDAQTINPVARDDKAADAHPDRLVQERAS